MTEVLKVWLDDTRPAPPDWVWCQTVDAAKVLLQTGKVDDLSLDHDLGTTKATGYDLCVWMADKHHWPANKPTVHSQNPIGAIRMRGVINRYGPYR